MSTLSLPLHMVISGTAGQGAVTAGIVFAEAAAESGRTVTQTSIHGAAVRSGDVSAHLIVSDTFIDYPFVESAHVFIALYADAFEKNEGVITTDTNIFYDEDTAALPSRLQGNSLFPIRAGALLKEHGLKADNLNLFFLGAFASTIALVEAHYIQTRIRALSSAVSVDGEAAFGLGCRFADSLFRARDL